MLRQFHSKLQIHEQSEESQKKLQGILDAKPALPACAQNSVDPCQQLLLPQLPLGQLRALSFFLIKCKNIIDQKGAGVQQYKEKGTKSFDQIESKTSLLNIK